MELIAAGDISPDVEVGPFHAQQRALGATFYEDYGSLWAANFGDPVSEYWAIRRGAGLWDTSALVKFRVTGRDALLALDRLFTRQLMGARPGLVRYGMLLDEGGLMLDEGTVSVISAEEAYFFGNDGEAEFVEHLVSKTLGLDVQFVNVSQAIPSLAIQGPRSFEVVSQLTDVDLSDLRWFHCLPEPVQVGGLNTLLLRAGFTGELGYEFYLLDGHDDVEPLWDAARAAGAKPVGLDAIEMVRVEAGLLIAEEDYFPGETDPLDLGMERFIDVDGHDFIGRDALLKRLPNPRRRFVTLALPGDAPPAGAAVTSRDSGVVGDVRSAYVTPRFGALALAVVDAKSSAPGLRLTVGDHEGVVHPVPIDDPDKHRPRSDPRSPVPVPAPRP